MSNYPLYNTPATVNQTQLIGVGTLDFWDIENQDFKSLTVDDNTLFLEGVPLGGGNITVRDIDGTPSITASVIEFTNGTVTDQGSGVARVTISGGGGGGGNTPNDITVANEASDTSCFICFFISATGDLGPKTNAALTFNSATASLACTTFVGDLTGNASTVTTNANLTGHVTSVGNAAVLGSFTKSQLDTAVSDGNVMYIGDAPTAHNQAWSTITSTPTTLSGYGITDAANITHVHAASDITSGTVDPARLGSGSSITTKFLRGDSTWQTISGGGDALTTNPLSQFAATTSAQLAGVISDETGSGALVFATSPTLVTPLLGTPTSGILTNCTGTASGLTAGNVTTNANLTGHVTSVGNAAVLGSFTKSQLDSAVSDGNVLYVGDVTSNATHTGDVTGSTALTIASGVVTPAMQTTASRTFTICGFGIDGGGVALTTQTLAAEYTVPVAMTLTGYNAACDTGTFTVKFWKIATGTALPTSANSINTSGVGISTGTALRSSTLTDFTTTAFAAGDIVRCAITAVSGATFLKVALEGTKD